MGHLEMEFVTLLEKMAGSSPYAVIGVVVAILYFRDRKEVRSSAPATVRTCENHAVLIEKLTVVIEQLKEAREMFDEIFTRQRKTEAKVAVLESIAGMTIVNDDTRG